MGSRSCRTGVQELVMISHGEKSERSDLLPFVQDQHKHPHLRDRSATGLLVHPDSVKPKRFRSRQVPLHRNRVVVDDEAGLLAEPEEQESKREYLKVARLSKSVHHSLRSRVR